MYTTLKCMVLGIIRYICIAPCCVWNWTVGCPCRSWEISNSSSKKGGSRNRKKLVIERRRETLNECIVREHYPFRPLPMTLIHRLAFFFFISFSIALDWSCYGKLSYSDQYLTYICSLTWSILTLLIVPSPAFETCVHRDYVILPTAHWRVNSAHQDCFKRRPLLEISWLITQDTSSFRFLFAFYLGIPFLLLLSFIPICLYYPSL
jgi:hypothetical protein